MCSVGVKWVLVLGSRELEDASVKVEGAVVIVLHALRWHDEKRRKLRGEPAFSQGVRVRWRTVESVTPGKLAERPRAAAAAT